MDRAAPSFQETLRAAGLRLAKAAPQTLQVNTGLLCNLACRHCHLEAGPDRTEVMSRATMEAVLSLARRMQFSAVDVTGGAPELVPGIAWLLGELAPLAGRRVFRTNLLALRDRPELVELFARDGWTLVASLPAVNESQVEAMRGPGVFRESLAMLRRLNQAGYGAGAGLELHLVSNPAGAFLPPGQCAAEKAFKRELERLGVRFDSLFVFANMPLGRFRSWLERTGNLDRYLADLRARFNPSVVDGLMCRTIVSVSWDGRLYDCDFNQAAGLPSLGARRLEDLAASEAGLEVATGDHCFACTAGSGFT